MNNELKEEFNKYSIATEKQQVQLKALVERELLKEVEALEKHKYYESVRKASIVADNYHFPEPIYAHQVFDAITNVAHLMGEEMPLAKELNVVVKEMKKAYNYSKNNPERLKLLLKLEANVKISWEENFHQKVDFFNELNYHGMSLGQEVIQEIRQIVANK